MVAIVENGSRNVAQSFVVYTPDFEILVSIYPYR
jgi:hypothetical protein